MAFYKALFCKRECIVCVGGCNSMPISVIMLCSCSNFSFVQKTFNTKRRFTFIAKKNAHKGLKNNFKASKTKYVCGCIQ